MNNIILYDGNCGICSFLADWLKRNDKKNKFLLIPNQSDMANALSFEYSLTDMASTVYLIRAADKKIFKYSSAVFEVLKGTDGCWRYLGILLSNQILSLALNPLYKIISRNRNRISGLLKLERCDISIK